MQHVKRKRLKLRDGRGTGIYFLDFIKEDGEIWVVLKSDDGCYIDDFYLSREKANEMSHILLEIAKELGG